MVVFNIVCKTPVYIYKGPLSFKDKTISPLSVLYKQALLSAYVCTVYIITGKHADFKDLRMFLNTGK